MSKYFCLPLQIDFCIDVGCVDGYVAEPRADSVDIHSGAKEVGRRCMPDRVGADRPVRQCWARGCDGAYVLADHPMNSMPR